MMKDLNADTAKPWDPSQPNIQRALQALNGPRRTPDLVEEMRKRRDELKQSLNHVESWKRELEIIERMLEAYGAGK